ncbi:TetR/AcrR family transcriptional regulator [Actinomadura roseirufa]|uniref:TetR/AcrR family transcriptional regulator n=1 Tax=Actinomadura roseirufa TaxID=2094049 RepID=UPI001F5EB42F|nr:TetR/AcrR family transcriptional regulator [Actinomadura roseirufa]
MQKTPTRRERVRAQTIREIKVLALKQMAAEGPAAISLRKIARDMGMTSGALYSYYDTRDDLLTALIADVYGSLADVLAAARDSVPASDPAGRMMAYARAYRQWAITHPDEFRLLYGDPAPGYQVPEGGPAAEAEHRACGVLAGLVVDFGAGTRPAAAPPDGASRTGDTHQWDDFYPRFAEGLRRSFPGLSAETAGLALRVWGRMHGLVSLEVYGHLRTQTHDPAKLYNIEMADLVGSLERAAN